MSSAGNCLECILETVEVGWSQVSGHNGLSYNEVHSRYFVHRSTDVDEALEEDLDHVLEADRRAAEMEED